MILRPNVKAVILGGWLATGVLASVSAEPSESTKQELVKETQIGESPGTIEATIEELDAMMAGQDSVQPSKPMPSRMQLADMRDCTYGPYLRWEGDLTVDYLDLLERRKVAEAELKTLEERQLPPDHWAYKWAGEYVGFPVSTNRPSIIVAPNAGVIYLCLGCFGPCGGDRAEIVEVFPDGLGLRPVLNQKHSEPTYLTNRIYFVPWNGGMCLVPDSEMLLFVNSYNAGRRWPDEFPSMLFLGRSVATATPDFTDEEMFHVRPELPEEFAALLHPTPLAMPITATRVVIEAAHAKEQRETPSILEFALGSNDGVFVGMEFAYPSDRRDWCSMIRVTRIDATTSTGEWIVAAHLRGSLPEPKVGDVLMTATWGDRVASTANAEPAPK